MRYFRVADQSPPGGDPVLVEPCHDIRYSNMFPDRLDEFFAKLRQRAVGNAVDPKTKA